MSRRVNLGVWEKLAKLIYVLLALSGVIGVALWYMPLMKRNHEVRKELKALEARIRLENSAIQELRIALDAVKNDTNTVERLARERLGYAKEGESVIRFQQADPVINVMTSD